MNLRVRVTILQYPNRIDLFGVHSSLLVSFDPALFASDLLV
jgi:hypothetical protein